MRGLALCKVLVRDQVAERLVRPDIIIGFLPSLQQHAVVPETLRDVIEVIETPPDASDVRAPGTPPLLSLSRHNRPGGGRLIRSLPRRSRQLRLHLAKVLAVYNEIEKEKRGE